MSGTVEMNRVSEAQEGAPVPAAVPGGFVVYLGTDDVPDGLDPDLTALLLT